MKARLDSLVTANKQQYYRGVFVSSVETCTDFHVTVFKTVTLLTSNSPQFNFKSGLDFVQKASNSYE